MFLKTGELKKMMKSALKSDGLYVGNIEGSYLIHSGTWGLNTDIIYASNKFKAAVTEVIGDIPEPGEYYKYSYQDKAVVQDIAYDCPSAYEQWKGARDYAAYVPLDLHIWPHAYAVLQIHSDLSYKLANRSLTSDVISKKELDLAVENMPNRPNYHNGALYWKNDTTIYWVCTIEPGEKIRKVLFPSLEELDFFQEDWLKKENRQEEEAPLEEGLPY